MDARNCEATMMPKTRRIPSAAAVMARASLADREWRMRWTNCVERSDLHGLEEVTVRTKRPAR